LELNLWEKRKMIKLESGVFETQSFQDCPNGADNKGYMAHFVHPKICFANPSHIPNIMFNFQISLAGQEQLNNGFK